MGDGKLIIISVAASGIDDRIRFYSQMLCTTTAVNTSNTIRTQTGVRLIVEIYTLTRARLVYDTWGRAQKVRIH